MRLEIQLSTAAVGYVRVQLGRREVGMAEHLLNGAKVGAALEQVRREGVAEEVRMDALRLEPGFGGEPAEDQERARAGEPAAARVQEELRPVTRVEVRTAAREITPQRLRGGAADRHNALLAPLADAADEPRMEVDISFRESDGLAHAQAGAVQQLRQRAVAQGARGGSVCGFDQTLGLERRQGARQCSPSAGEVEL